MRESTHRKLFAKGEEPRYLMQFDIAGGIGTMITINGHTAIVQEFENEKDGFEVWTAVPGNSVMRCRKALGLPTPPEMLGDLLDEDERAKRAKVYAGPPEQDDEQDAAAARWEEKTERENR
jgi:hypothetical protein